MAGRNALVLRHDDLASLVADVKTGDFTTQTFRHQRKFDLLAQFKLVKFEEAGKDFLVGHAQRAQQRGYGHLAAAVDAEEQRVLRIKFKINPRAAVRNHAGRKQQLARRVGLAPIVLEKYARRAVQLADENALSPVDNE